MKRIQPIGLRQRLQAGGKLIRLHWLMAARLMISAFGSYAIAESLGLAQSFWSVITALVITQSSIGATVNASIDRMIGTVLGALIGALVGALHPLGAPDWLQLLIAMVPLGLIAAAKPPYRIAPITAVIVIMAGNDFHPFWLGAAYRIMEIGLGTVVGVFVSMVVLPSRAHQSIRRQCARALGPLADLLETYLAERGHFRMDRVHRLHDAARAAIAAAEKAMQEARREPGARNLEMGVEIRALRRIHSDITFVGRATSDWPADAQWPALDHAIDALESTLRRALDGLSHALLHGGATGAVRDIDGAIGQLIDALEQAPMSLSMKPGVLPFTLQTLRRDLGDFADILNPDANAKH